jgi:hypothetical protein
VPQVSLESQPSALRAEPEVPQPAGRAAQQTRQPSLLSAQRRVGPQRDELELEQSARLSPQAAWVSRRLGSQAEPAVESLKVQAAWWAA